MPVRSRQSAAGPTSRAVAADWTPPVTDEALTAKTGHSWQQWIDALDAEGCAKMSHREIVEVVAGRFDVGAWWRQTVTVGYERARGLREVHETSRGFAASGSKTVNVGIDTLWNAWNDAKTRSRWLADPVVVRGSTPMKSIRITWPDGTDVQAWFTDKGAGKSAVSVDHRKLQQADVAPTKASWKERLAALKSLLEGGQ